MIVSTGKLTLSVEDRRALISADQTLVDTLRTKANWIWCPDTRNPGGPDSPSAPDGEQCIFRNKFFYPTSKGKPTKTTLIVTADDYLALYVDGVMVQPADITHDWKLLYAFQVPLPVVQNQTASSLLLGLRGINKTVYVGIIAAAQVEYETGEPDVFYTGLNDEWRAQRIFDEGWEQPWYNSNSWRPSANISQSARSPSESLLAPAEVAVFEALPADAGSDPSQSESVQRASIELSIELFVGILIGSILAAIVVGAIGAYLILRRRHAHRPIETWSDNGGVVPREHALMAEPAQPPREPQSSTSYYTRRHASQHGSYHPPSGTLSPFTQMASSSVGHNSDRLPPKYARDSETPVATGTIRRK